MPQPATLPDSEPPRGPWTKYQQPGPWTKYQRPPASPRIVEFEGVRHEFPADFSDEEVAKALDSVSREQAVRNDVPTSPADAVRSHPPGQPGPQIPGVDVALNADGTIAGPARFGVPVEPTADGPRSPAGRFASHIFGSEDPTRDLQIGTQAVGRGVANTLGAPFDLSNLLANAGLSAANLLSTSVGGPEVDFRFRGSVADRIADTASRTAERAGVDLIDREELSPLERLTYDIGDFGTQALMFSSGLASAPVQAATRASKGAAGALTRPYRNAPGAVVSDTAAGGGAGAGHSLYDDYTPDAVKDRLGPIGGILAMMGGGVGGATLLGGSRAAAGATGNLVRKIGGAVDPNAPINPATGRPYSRGEMDIAARAVQKQASNPATARLNIRDSIDEFGQFASPGEMPTATLLADDVGLGLLERQARAYNARPFAERDRALTSRAGELVGSAAPRDAVARAFTNAADGIQRSRVDAAQRRVSTAETRAADVDAARRAAGESLAEHQGQGAAADLTLDRSIVEGSLRPRQESKNRAFEAIDPDRTEVRDATPLIQAAQDIRATLGRLSDPETVLPTDTLRRIEALSPEAGGTGTITFGELNSVRPQLSAAETRARAAGEYPLADNIRTLRSAIDAETARLAAEPTDAGRRATEATRLHREEFAPVWNVGPGDEATQFRKQFNLDRQRRTTTPPSQTASRFLQAGQPERARALQRIIASTANPEEAQSAVRQHLISDLASSGVVDAKTGTLRPDRLRLWRDRWGGALDIAPEVRAELDTLTAQARRGETMAGQLADDVKAAKEGLTDAQQNRGALGLVLGKDPVKAVASVFGSGDPEKAMRDLKRAIGSKVAGRDALGGLKAATRDYILKRASTSAVQRTVDGGRPISFDQLDKIFRDSERVLAEVYSPKEMNALRQAHRLLAPLKQLQTPGYAPASAERNAENAWRLLEGGLKARFGVLKGGGILRTMRIFVQTLPDSSIGAGEIVQRMFFDPDLAMHLLGREVFPDSPKWNRKLLLLLAGAEAGREGQNPDE